MAPATNIGAASPVMLGGGNVDKTMMKKIENDAAAFIRTVALERGRNADWAEKAVRQAVSITEREAVRLRVVDLVADSMPDLLQKIDGRTVKTPRGMVTLHTRGAPVKAIEIGFRDRVLNVITDPNVAYVLMMLGMLGLFFELSNPGAVLPGVIGGISLILAFFAFQSLPINYAGLLLILFGIVLLVAEIKIVSHGILAIGGIVSMALGSLMLFAAPEIGLRVSWWAVVPMVGATAGLFLFGIAAGGRARAILNPGGQGNGPGLVLLVPLIDKMVRVSLQTVALDVAPQDVITRDNVSLKVSAVIYFRVVDPERAVIAVQDYLYATSQIAQTTLRSVLGQVELDDLLSARDKINQQLQRIIDEHTEPWGIKVATVEVKQIDLPQDMQRAMAKQAEAERERRAKVINADGEFQAAAKLSEAAEVLTRHPIAVQLRYLQTMREIASERSATTFFPLPLDLFGPLLQAFNKGGDGSKA